jgi:hypothetical protein
VSTIDHKRGRASVKLRDFNPPKPYHKKAFVEDNVSLSRVRMTALALSGLLAASLVAALVLVAKDSLDPAPVPVVAAAVPALPAVPPAAAPPMRLLPVTAAPRPAVPAAAALPPRAPRVPRPVPRPEAPAPDPDVLLIAAILMLTPSAEAPPAPGCAAHPRSDSSCHALHAIDP